jgi:hypothetical protein
MPVNVEMACVEVRECGECPWHQMLPFTVQREGDTWLESQPVCELSGNKLLPPNIDELASPPAWCPLRNKLTIVAITSRIVT